MADPPCGERVVTAPVQSVPRGDSGRFQTATAPNAVYLDENLWVRRRPGRHRTHRPEVGGMVAEQEITRPRASDAVRWVAERGEASTSVLQRRFRIGFQWASRLLDTMEERGVGPTRRPAAQRRPYHAPRSRRDGRQDVGGERCGDLFPLFTRVRCRPPEAWPPTRSLLCSPLSLPVGLRLPYAPNHPYTIAITSGAIYVAASSVQSEAH